MGKIFITIAIIFFISWADLFAYEPEIYEVYKIAVDKAKFLNANDDNWEKRARNSAWLPSLQGGIMARDAINVNVDVNDSVYVGSSGVTVGPEDKSITESADYKRDFFVKATWNLSELVFSKYQMGISGERRNLYKEKRLLLEQVRTAYQMRRTMLAKLELLKKGRLILKKDQNFAMAKTEIELNIENAISTLDALTEGWYGAQLKKEVKK